MTFSVRPSKIRDLQFAIATMYLYFWEIHIVIVIPFRNILLLPHSLVWLLGFGTNRSLLFIVQYWGHHIETRQMQYISSCWVSVLSNWQHWCINSRYLISQIQLLLLLCPSFGLTRQKNNRPRRLNYFSVFEFNKKVFVKWLLQ